MMNVNTFNPRSILNQLISMAPSTWTVRCVWDWCGRAWERALTGEYLQEAIFTRISPKCDSNPCITNPSAFPSPCHSIFFNVFNSKQFFIFCLLFLCWFFHVPPFQYRMSCFVFLVLPFRMLPSTTGFLHPERTQKYPDLHKKAFVIHSDFFSFPKI